jgi:hypothetical protein
MNKSKAFMMTSAFRMFRRLTITVSIVLVALPGMLVAQETTWQEEGIIENPANAEQGASNTDLAKAVQNPIADLISLPFQNNTFLDWGVDGDPDNTLNIQPVWPLKMNDDWNVITRTIVPVKSQPAATSSAQGRETGLGNTTFTAFFSPSDSGGLTWGVGPVVIIPTATDDRLGGDTWGAGVSLVALTLKGKWVIGSLFSQVWDIKGSEDPAKSNEQIDLFTWQPFINYNLNDGWYLTTAPIISRDGEAKSGEEWLVPLGGGAGKIVRIGKMPVNISAQAYYNVVKPEDPVNVGDWQTRLQVQLLFPKGK